VVTEVDESLSATRVNKQHDEGMFGVGLPIMAPSQLILLSKLAPAIDAKVSSDTIVQLLPPYCSGLIATVEGEVDMTIRPIERVVYTAKAHATGACARPMRLARGAIATKFLREV
jgi:hypothetical protein